MNRLRKLTILLACGAFLLPSLSAGDLRRERDRDRNPRSEEREKDDATARREAMLNWYGGDWSPEFRAFMLEAAAKERVRYADQMPRLDGDPLLGLAATGTTWTNLGPTNADSETNGSTLFVRDSGRPVSIVVDPTNTQIIYLATSGGGVWKTTTGGTSWTAITDTMGTLACGALAMDPNNHNTLYLGLGDAFDGTGIGFVKSTDGGTSWSAPVFLGTSTSIRDVQVCPTDSTIILAATNAGLFRSTNSGASFTQVSIATGVATAPVCWQLAYGGGTNWAMTVEADTTNTAGSGQIYYSSDNGVTWAQATGMTKTGGIKRLSMASAPSQRLTMYAMGQRAAPSVASDPATDLADIFKSTDGGHTWTALNANTKNYTNTNSESSSLTKLLGGQGFYNHVILVDPTNPSIAYFGGQLLLCQTSDGGSTFSQKTNWLAQFSLPYVHADFHAGAIDASGTIYVGTDGGIFKQTSAASNTWTSDLNIGIASHLIYSVGSSLNNRNAVIGGFQDNGTRVRSGTTATFNQQIGGDGFGSNINPTNAQNMLGTLYYTRVYKSTDGGSTFSAASTGITESNNPSTGVFTTRVVPGLADATGNTVYTFANLKVYKSTNYAGSWTATAAAPVTTGNIRAVAAAKSDGTKIGVTANSGRVFLSANSGSSWTQVADLTTNNLPNSSGGYSYLWFDTANFNTVYVASVYPSATSNHIWKSSNFGSTWTAIDGSAASSNGFPFGVPVNTIQNDPGDSLTLYAGTHLGVYKSSDGGSTWTRFGSGMPLVNVTDFYVAPDSSLLRASTFGRGFWELNPGVTVTAPAIVTQPASTTVAVGSTASFSVTASGTAPLTYQWSKNAAAISGATSATYTTPATVAGDNGSTFSVVVSNSAGTATSTNATLTVSSPTAPAITSQPSNATVTVGATASFSVTASGTAPLSYQWKKNGTAITGATSSSYTTPATVSGDNGATFSVVVTNSAGSATSNNATLTVNPIAAPSITSQPASATVNAGSTATFSVTATGAAPLSYQWRKNAVNISGATSASYTTPATVIGDSGATFSVVVTNGGGSVTSTNATLTVNPIVGGTFLEVEANNSIATANAVAASYTAIQGNLTTTTDVDYFALTLTPGQKVTINMTGPTGPDWDLYLKNSAGTTLTSSTGSTTTESLTYTNTGATSITVYPEVIVYATASASPYTLALTYVTPPPSVTYNEVEANNSIATANAVPDTATKIVGYISSSTDNDYFAVNVGAGKTLSVGMTGPTGTAYDYDLYFYNAAGTTLASGLGSTTTENVSWTNGATATTVYVAVIRYAGSSTTTPYNLTLSR